MFFYKLVTSWKNKHSLLTRQHSKYRTKSHIVTVPILYIIQKYKLTMFENFVCFAEVRCVYKVINGTTPPPLKHFITLRPDSGTGQWKNSRRDCIKQCRYPEFGKSALSFRATESGTAVASTAFS